MREEAGAHPLLRDADAVRDYVRQAADTVHDPCGMAVGVRIGLDEMGLLRRIEAEKDDRSCWSVRADLRLTGPGCQYFFAFKANLEELLMAHPQISHAVVEWDPSLDWSPENLSRAARSKLEKRRATLWPTVVSLGAGPPGRDGGGAR